MVHQMKPGRELDALVAEKVMDWENNKDGPTYFGERHGQIWAMNDGPVIDCPCYSTDISAAWEVVDELRILFPYYRLTLFMTNNEAQGSGLKYGFSVVGNMGQGSFSTLANHVADTPMMAICGAALEACKHLN